MVIDADDRRHHRPRFARTAPPPFQLTERDVIILREVGRHGLLNSDHISALLDGPHKKICDRLTRLYHAGYLDRPRAQLAYHVGGSAAMVYALNARGARLLLERRDATPIHFVAVDSERLFLFHALAVADFRVALRLALRARPDVRLIDQTLLASPATPMRVTIAGIATVAIVPDCVFSLHCADGAGRNFFVEIDRGTMPIERASLAQSSVIRKLLAYEEARQSRLAEKHHGWRNFRVLILTATPERADNIRAAIARSRLATSPLFLITDASVLDDNDLLAMPWHDSNGRMHTLI